MENDAKQIEIESKQSEDAKEHIENQNTLIQKKIAEFNEKLKILIEECNQVYLTTHQNMDFDAIASLGAISVICRQLNKSPYIIVNRNEYKNLKYEESRMLEEIEKRFAVNDLEWFNANKTEKALLICVDVNRGFMTELRNNYDDFENIVIIDHHDENDDTIKTKYKLILNEKKKEDTEPVYIASSCSEIMYWLLKQYQLTKIDIDDIYYTFLLAGIYLDTDGGNKNKFSSTRKCIDELIDEKGADEDIAKSFLSVDYETDRKIQRLVDNTEWVTIRYAIGIGNEIYTAEEIAKAADYALKYTCEAAIYAGKDKTGNYLVKARSNRGNVDIEKLMYILNRGGGNRSSAAARPIFIDGDSIEEEHEKLFKKIKEVIYHQKESPRKRYYIKSKKLKRTFNKEDDE